MNGLEAAAASDDELVALVRDALVQAAPERAARLAAVTIDTRLDDLDLDSIAVIETIGIVEDAVGRVFERQEVAGVRTVRDIATLMRSGGADAGRERAREP